MVGRHGLFLLALASSCSASGAPPAAASALWSSLGVAPGSARMRRLATLTANRAVFANRALLEERRQVLANAVGADAARLILLRSPLIITSDLERRLPERIVALHTMLPGIGSLDGLLVRAPALLVLTEPTLVERLMALDALLSPASGRASRKSKRPAKAAFVASEATARVVRRSPTLIQLPDLAARVLALEELLELGSAGTRRLVQRAPSLLAYDPRVLRRKLSELRELFPHVDAGALVRREPQLLTYDVTSSLSAKVASFATHLPTVDVHRLLATTPRLMTYDAERLLPRKLSALESLLPGADVPRLVRHVPQLLEYDVEGTLAPKVRALRKLFHPAAVSPPPPPPSAVQRLAAAKLVAARRGRKAPAGGGAAAAAAAVLSKNAARSDGRTRDATRVGGGASGGRALSAVALVRLASLDMAVVEKRLGGITQMLPEVDAVALVSRQPALLRRDVERSLKPRLAFLCKVLGEETAAETIAANPRLLLSSWGVLGRLVFVSEAPEGSDAAAVSPSLALMTPKAAWATRFPQYRGWLEARLRGDGGPGGGDSGGRAEWTVQERRANGSSGNKPKRTDVDALEKEHGAHLEEQYA
jgi:hypothetical protein